jgi:hypothetical protein
MDDYSYSTYDVGIGIGRLRILDYLLLFISLLLIVLPFINGISYQNMDNINAQKEKDFAQLNKALTYFFESSSSIPSQRKYPISVCSGQPNEVDFEYTLRRHLTGKIKELDNFEHIKDENFVSDRLGFYSVNTNERKVKLRDCDQVFGVEIGNNKVYDNGYKSCNFQKDSKDTTLRNCYLYASDNRGFQYQLAYYDEKTDKYNIFTKFREDDIKRTSANR